MGAHEPPTRRSFYLSLAASTLRFAIIVALVVGGIVVINQAFPSAPSGGTAPIDEVRTITESPSPSPSPSESPAALPSPTVLGVRIAVFNGAGVSGLAGDTTAQLEEKYGYVAVQDPADAPSPVPVTTIYYRKNKDKIEAEFLANDFFKKLDDVRIAKLQAGADVDPNVQLAIYLGSDYAALKG